MKDNEVLSYVELSEEEKQIVNEYIKRIDIYDIKKMQILADIETKKLYKEQDMLTCIQTKFDIELTDFSDDSSDVDKNIDLFKKYFVSLKKKFQRIITRKKDNYEESFDLNKIRDEFIDINFELKLRSDKLIVIRETLLNHYKNLRYQIIALQNVEKELPSEVNDGTISKDYEKIIIKEKINNTISNLKGIRINIANSIAISENLAQQYKELAEKYDENKMFSLIQDLYTDGINGYTEHSKFTNEMVPIRFARLEKRINNLYSVCEALHRISASTKTGFNELKLLMDRLHKRYDTIINTSQYDKYPELEIDIISELAQIECKIEEYLYDTRKSAEEIIAHYIKKIYNSDNYKDFHDLETELHKLEAIEELNKQYSPYLETEVKRELQKQIIVLKFNLLYRKQVELLIYGNEKNKCSFVEYNLSNREKEWFEFLFAKKIKDLKDKCAKALNQMRKEEALFQNSIKQILYDRNLLERFIIMDMRYNSKDYINLLKAKIFNAHLCNIGNNPFEPEVYITAKQINNLSFNGNKSGDLEANKVNYSLLVALLKNIITDENVSFIECENLYRRFGFKCNPIIFNIGQECVKIIFNQVKLTDEYSDIANSVIKKDKGKIEMPYCKMDFEGLLYYFEDKIIDENEFFENVIAQRDTSTTELRSNNTIADMRKEAWQIYMVKPSLHYMKIYLNKMRCICSEFGTIFNLRSNVPLEYMSDQVFLVKVPEKVISYKTHFSRIYGKHFNDVNGQYIIRNLKPLWIKYKKDFEDLGIEVHKLYPDEFNEDARVNLIINLNDISDLPINYEKIKLLTNKEHEQLMKAKKQKKWSRDSLVGRVNSSFNESK